MELGHPGNGAEESNGLPQRGRSEDQARAHSWRRVEAEGKDTVALSFELLCLLRPSKEDIWLAVSFTVSPR